MRGEFNIGLAALLVAVVVQGVGQPHMRQVPVTFTGGYVTNPRDNGRPVVLIASALGVPANVFRKAFSGVTPARGRAPEPDQVHRNKEALLSALAPFGITNELLDTVSDYYRYRRDRGEMWRNTPAEAYAVISKGRIVSFRITNPGSGYTSAPTASVPGFESIPLSTTVTYSRRFESNGSLASISIASNNK